MTLPQHPRRPEPPQPDIHAVERTAAGDYRCAACRFAGPLPEAIRHAVRLQWRAA